MNENSIITEIQEDLNRERMTEFFKKHGKYVYTLVIIGILAIGGFEAWKNIDQKNRAEAGDKLYKIINSFSETSDTKEIVEIQKTGAYKDVGKLIEANMYEAKKNDDATLKAYEKLANDSSAEKGLRELASLNIISMKLNKNPADASVEADLKKLSGADGIYKYTALEMLGAYYRANGKNAEAKAAYTKLANDETAPRSLSGRAHSMLSSF